MIINITLKEEHKIDVVERIIRTLRHRGFSYHKLSYENNKVVVSAISYERQHNNLIAFIQKLIDVDNVVIIED